MLPTCLYKISRIYRIFDWFHYLGFTLLGLSLRNFNTITVTFHLFLSGFLLAYAYSLNDYYDKHQRKKFFFLPLILSLPFLYFLNKFQLVLVILFLLIMTFYSAKPFRFKSIPIICTFCNGIGFSILFLIGAYYHTNSTLSVISLFYWLFFFQMAAQLIHEMVHLEEDKKENILTTAIYVGEKNTKRLCYLFLFLAFVTSYCLFWLRITNLFLFSISAIFILFFMFEIKVKEIIDEKLRKMYRIIGTLVGFAYFIYFTL